MYKTNLLISLINYCLSQSEHLSHLSRTIHGNETPVSTTPNLGIPETSWEGVFCIPRPITQFIIEIL